MRHFETIVVTVVPDHVTEVRVYDETIEHVRKQHPEVPAELLSRDMNEIAPFNVAYDVEGDVLYINRSDTPAARGIEDEMGVVWRYDEFGALIGATILDAREIRRHRRAALAHEISSRFETPPGEIAILIENAVGARKDYLRAGKG